jgi:hypothetical protein
MTMVYVVVRLDWDGVEILKARYGRITDNSFDVQSFPLL